MPVHRRSPPDAGEQRSDLLDELIRELEDPKPIGQPIILEDDKLERNCLQVQVAWDRWEDCPREARSGIIAEAYEHVFGPERRKEITLALGLTIPEAAAMGLLPFQLLPARKKDENPAHDEYCKAMVQAGASVLSNVEEPELRCATLDDARETVKRLTQVVPNSEWIIVKHELTAFDD